LTPGRLIEYGSSARSSDRSYEAPLQQGGYAGVSPIRCDRHTRPCAPAAPPPKKPKLSIADDAPSTDKRRRVLRRNATPVGNHRAPPRLPPRYRRFASSYSRIDRCITTHPSK
jgi:hypothetical protein